MITFFCIMAGSGFFLVYFDHGKSDSIPYWLAGHLRLGVVLIVTGAFGAICAAVLP